MTGRRSSDIVIVRTSFAQDARQEVPVFFGAAGISMNVTMFPPGGSAAPLNGRTPS